MKAIVCDRYGTPDDLELAEVDKPVPGPGQVLVRVRAVSLNPLDWRTIRADPFIVRFTDGLLKPKHRVPGVDMAGTVEAVGDGVEAVRPGQRVFGFARGALAEYVCIDAGAAVPKPDNVSFAEAAAVPVAALTALQALRDKGRMQPGWKVLVNGAAGGVGTYAVQIARALGADTVTGVCSTCNHNLVSAIGADEVVDYTREDFTERCRGYDLMIDTVGNRSVPACLQVLRDGGNYVAVAGPLLRILRLMVTGGRRATMMVTKANAADVASVGELLASGRVKSVIDREYPLDEAAEALRYLEAGHARGKVVVTLRDDEHLPDTSAARRTTRASSDASA